MSVIQYPGPVTPCAGSPTWPGVGKAITPSDTDTFSQPVTVYVGVTGDVVIVPVAGDTTLTFKNVPQGSTVPCLATAVKATGTTATNLIGIV